MQASASETDHNHLALHGASPGRPESGAALAATQYNASVAGRAESPALDYADACVRRRVVLAELNFEQQQPLSVPINRSRAERATAPS